MPDIIFKQQYTHSLSGSKFSRDIKLDIDNIILENINSMTPKVLLSLIWWNNYDPVAHPDSRFTPVYADPGELLFNLLDAKRTTNPLNCIRTYLTDKAEKNNNFIYIHNNEEFNIGDPIVILNNLNGSQKTYAIITEINENKITLSSNLPYTFYVGAFVQNLANRWHKEVNIGARSQINRPYGIGILTETHNDFIEVGIHTPINLGVIQYYDIYVRNQKFSKIEAHWIPDVIDIPAQCEDNIKVFTYNGGESAGGGKLKKGNYYITLISKDNSGRVNVNESGIGDSPFGIAGSQVIMVEMP